MEKKQTSFWAPTPMLLGFSHLSSSCQIWVCGRSLPHFFFCLSYNQIISHCKSPNFETSKYLPSSLLPHNFTEGWFASTMCFLNHPLEEREVGKGKKNSSGLIIHFIWHQLSMTHPPTSARQEYPCLRANNRSFRRTWSRWVMEDVQRRRAKASGKEQNS